MAQKFKILDFKNNILSPSHSPKNPLYYIDFESCIYYKALLKNQTLSDENLFLQAYQDQALKLEEKYFLLYEIESLTQSIHCFFLPRSSLPKHLKFALLDIFLPTQLAQEKFCAIFIGNHQSILCFYQDQKLLFCRFISNLQEEIQTSKALLKSCFDFEMQDLYVLNYEISQRALHSLSSHCSIKPLFSLFFSTQDFGFPTCSFEICSFKNFIPTQAKSNYSLSKRFFKVLGFYAIGLLFLWVGMIVYEQFLQSKINSLDPNVSPPNLSLQTLQELKEDNYSQALKLYPLITPKHILALDTLLALFAPYQIKSFSFLEPKTFSFTLPLLESSSFLLTKLNSYGYKTSIQQEEDWMTFWIEVDDD